MCLAIPMRLQERTEFEGVVELDGVRRTISLMLLPDAEVGEHVLIHAGYAIGTVNEEEAARTLELLREYADHMVEL
jgi:hydrogenase expression/formation protein HypC